MELNEALKKIERLEHDTRVLSNRLNRQQIILDEFVALLEIQSKEDIELIEICVGVKSPLGHTHATVTIITAKDCISTAYPDSLDLGYLVDHMNSGGKLHLTLNKKYRKVPLSKLPTIKQRNLYTNNCLIIIKL